MSKEKSEGDVPAIFLIGFVCFVFGMLAGLIASVHLTSFEEWENSCTVSETVHSAGVQIQCQFGNRQIILTSQRGEYLPLVANTPSGQRSEIPTFCRHDNSGWFCRVGEGDNAFYNFTPVRLPPPAEES